MKMYICVLYDRKSNYCLDSWFSFDACKLYRSNHFSSCILHLLAFYFLVEKQITWEDLCQTFVRFRAHREMWFGFFPQRLFPASHVPSPQLPNFKSNWSAGSCDLISVLLYTGIQNTFILFDNHISFLISVLKMSLSLQFCLKGKKHCG